MDPQPKSAITITATEEDGDGGDEPTENETVSSV